MKKSIKILLMLLFCLCPVLLTACQKVEYFSISALSSSTSLGSVSGFSDNKVPQDSKVTLVATENYYQTNPLLCWIKNNETLVKIPALKEESDRRENTLELAVGAETEGQYIAVFSEELSSMMYAYIAELTPVLYNADGSVAGELTEENTTINLSYAIMSAGTNNYLPYQHDINSGNANVLYFGSLGESYEFKFRATVVVSFSEENQTTYTLSSDTITNKTSFDNNGLTEVVLSYKSDGKDVMTLTLGISKLNTNIYSYVDNKSAN